VNTILAAGSVRPKKKQPQISPSLLPLAIDRGRLPKPPFYQDASLSEYVYRKISLTAKIDYVTHRCFIYDEIAQGSGGRHDAAFGFLTFCDAISHINFKLGVLGLPV
jgi:hypothetical protein